MSGRTCPACGAGNALDDSFCSKCGARLAPPPSAPPLPPSAAPAPHPAPVQWGTGYAPHPGHMGGWPGPYGAGPMGPPEPARPTATLVLSVVGGILMLAAAALEIAIGTQISQPPFAPVGPVGGTLVLSGLLGIAFGVLVLMFGVLAYSQPQHHVVYGVLIIVFSVLSLSSFAGGFGIGFILGLIGGILAIAHNPRPAGMWMPYLPAPHIQRVCPKCGRVVDPNVRFCPHCGNALG